MVTTGKPQRNEKGQFVKGWQGGPGRPPRETERAYLAAFFQACGPDDLADVVSVVLREAKGGDMVACKLLLTHCLPWQMRLEMLSHVPESEEYRVAGRSASATNNVMMARLIAHIQATRARDAACGDWTPSDSKSKAKSKNPRK